MAIPWPTPMHIVERDFSPGCNSSMAVPVILAPDMPNGWPRLIAPLLGFTCGSSSAMPKSRKVARPCDAKALFSSMTLAVALDKVSKIEAAVT